MLSFTILGLIQVKDNLDYFKNEEKQESTCNWNLQIEKISDINRLYFKVITLKAGFVYMYNVCRSSGALLPDMTTADFQSMLVEGGVADTLDNQPLVVSPSASTCPTQPSPSTISTPQDLLVNSPLVINDPVMTPQCNSVPSPIIKSPANNMQVACVDEGQVTSPSHVTRSAFLL